MYVNDLNVCIFITPSFDTCFQGSTVLNIVGGYKLGGGLLVSNRGGLALELPVINAL